jgi:hypothetical protein
MCSNSANMLAGHPGKDQPGKAASRGASLLDGSRGSRNATWVLTEKHSNETERKARPLGIHVGSVIQAQEQACHIRVSFPASRRINRYRSRQDKTRSDYYRRAVCRLGVLPLALLLGFTLPVQCRVMTTRGTAYGNEAYGLLFGCNKAAGHWFNKFKARLYVQSNAETPIWHAKPSADVAVMYKITAEQAPFESGY